ncbi:MAG TPA: hypothetical protein VHD84_02305, partial [Candidatus Saccharimonadales bacterium]|nr:hypothetical protein [Candidatus Saccharimonadales bacterium]
PIDPLNGDGPGKERTFEHTNVIKPLSDETAAKAVQQEQAAPSSEPPAATAAADVNKARSAVESALAAAPFDPSLHPEERLGATPMGEELHQPAPAAQVSAEPSLPLPTNQPSSAPAANPTPQTPKQPPSVPPPIIPSSNVVIPTASQNQQK